MRFLDEGPDVPAPSAKQLKQIQAAMIDDLKPVRPLAPSGVFLLALAVVFLAVTAASPRLLGVKGLGVLHTGQESARFSALSPVSVPPAPCSGVRIRPASTS